jgi:hypothetical protein
VGLKEDHERRRASFPEAVRVAHEHSSNHREEVLAGTTCGCFYCRATFPTDEITEWTDEVDGVGQTALCPRCGIDSVIGDRSGFELSREFLSLMKSHWFSS